MRKAYPTISNATVKTVRMVKGRVEIRLAPTLEKRRSRHRGRSRRTIYRIRKKAYSTSASRESAAEGV